MATQTHHRSQSDEAGEARPRVGVPWRTAKEEADDNRPKIENYLRAVRDAGGAPELISLITPRAELDGRLRGFDAFLLPGSPADVNPARYGVKRHERCAVPDQERERTDYAILNHAFAAKKPVLAICYGAQLLNVYLGGALLQDIPSELRTTIRHDKEGLPPGSDDPHHAARIDAGSRLAGYAPLAGLAGEGFTADVNSSHHQAILTPGRDLRITARAPDGVVEAVEWTGTGNLVMGVQWHPERMKEDWLSEALFRDLISAARALVSGVRG